MHKYIPSTLDSSAVDTCINALLGQAVDACHAVDSAYHLMGYTLGKIVPCGHLVVGVAGLTPKEKADALRTLVAAPDVVAAPEIPWYLIWQVVKEIVERYLQGK